MSPQARSHQSHPSLGPRRAPNSQHSPSHLPASPSINTLQMTEEGSGGSSPVASRGGGDMSHRVPAGGSYFPSQQQPADHDRKRRGGPQDSGDLLGAMKGWRKTYELEGVRGVRTRLQLHLSQLSPPVKLLLILGTTACIYLYLLPPKAGSPHGGPLSALGRGGGSHPASQSAARVLSLPGGHAAVGDRKTGKYKSKQRAKTVENWSNPFGFVSVVDARWRDNTFDPTVLALPQTLGPELKYLVVLRAKERMELFDGQEMRTRELLGSFFHEIKNDRLHIPKLFPVYNVDILPLPAQRTVDYARCDNPYFDQFVGPEEPKLFFTAQGAPLLMYSQTGDRPGICRGPALIDARTLFPKLGPALKKAGWNPPVEFAEQTHLLREGQANVERNWVPFIGENKSLWFAASAVPQMMYKWAPGGEPLQAVQSAVSYSNCLTRVVGEHLDRAYHHATPLLRGTLCRRGECAPDEDNTVLFGIVHVKFPQDYAWYERRVVTYSTKAPYDILSVSRPIMYSGTNGDDPIVTTSMSWQWPTEWDGGDLNSGFLDDVLLTSFGAHDFQGNYIDILARDLLTGHTMCDALN